MKKIRDKKLKKHFGVWLLITLVMAIGIGAIGAITIANKADKTGNDASISSTEQSATNEEAAETGDEAGTNSNGKLEIKSYLSNQRKHDIDMDLLAILVGDYDAAPAEMQGSDIDEPYWRLSISADHGDDGPYLSIYDGEAGNPGFEGPIMYLKDELVILEVDQDLYDKMPADWKLEGEDKYAILDIRTTEKGVKLGYRGTELLFLAD